MRAPFAAAAPFVAAAPCVAAALLVLGVASSVHATDAEVERARALLESGDAAGALRVVTHVEARTDLPASELITLLVVRARSHAALGDTAALATDARLLVALAPSWQAPADAPEPLRAALDEARVAHLSPPALDVDTYRAANALRIVIEIDDDDLGTVRGTRLSWRLEGETAWHRSVESDVLVRGLAGTRVEYHVEALGPGGVVVAREGSEASPKHATVPGTDAADGLGATSMSSGNSTTMWLIAGGVVVAAVVLVLVLFATGGGGERTELGVPIVEWP